MDKGYLVETTVADAWSARDNNTPPYKYVSGIFSTKEKAQNFINSGIKQRELNVFAIQKYSRIIEFPTDNSKEDLKEQ